MKTRFLISFIAALLLAAPCSLWGAERSLQGAEPTDWHPIFDWLSAQQDKRTGLVPSQQDTSASTYNNALAVMAFVLNNQVEKAQRILDFFKNRCNTQEFYVGKEPRGFFQYRDSTTGEPPCRVNRWMGDNAWLAMAIHHYKKATGDSTYDGMANAIVSLLSSFQQPGGYIASALGAIRLWKRDVQSKRACQREPGCIQGAFPPRTEGQGRQSEEVARLHGS